MNIAVVLPLHTTLMMASTRWNKANKDEIHLTNHLKGNRIEEVQRRQSHHQILFEKDADWDRRCRAHVEVGKFASLRHDPKLRRGSERGRV
jgi:hypothetical protein